MGPSVRQGDGLSTSDEHGNFWIQWVDDPGRLKYIASADIQRSIAGIAAWRKRVMRIGHDGNRQWYTGRADQQLAFYSQALAERSFNEPTEIAASNKESDQRETAIEPIPRV